MDALALIYLACLPEKPIFAYELSAVPVIHAKPIIGVYTNAELLIIYGPRRFRILLSRTMGCFCSRNPAAEKSTKVNTSSNRSVSSREEVNVK